MGHGGGETGMAKEVASRWWVVDDEKFVRGRTDFAQGGPGLREVGEEGKELVMFEEADNDKN